MTTRSRGTTTAVDEPNGNAEALDIEPPALTAADDEVRGQEPAARPDERYFNRELSQIAYHRRVMESAKDVSQPLLERLRSVAFFEDGVDEFFMTRVSAR